MKRLLLRGLVSAAILAGLALALPEPAEAQRRERDLITLEELKESSKERANLFQAIRSLRPHFLQGPRGQRSVGGGGVVPRVPIVYLNGGRAGDATMLREIQTVNVAEVRFVPPTEASNLYGLEHGAGAIFVTLINRAPDST